MVATAGVNGLNFLFHVLISRLLGPSYYGALGAVLNVISVLAVPLGAVQLAVTQAVISGTGKEQMSLRGLTVKATLWGAGAMVAFWLLAPLVDGFLNLKSPFTDLGIGVWIPVAVVAAVLQGALLGEMRYVPVAVASFVGGGALRLASGALLVSAGFGLGGAVAATVIGQAFTTAALLLVARQEVFAKGLDSVRISLRDAVLSIAALAGYTTLTGIDVFLARHFLAPVAAGRYAAAAIAGHIALFLPGALVTVAFPRLVSANATGVSARKTLTETLGLVTVIGLAAFAVLAAIPGVVVDVLFGPNYLRRREHRRDHRPDFRPPRHHRLAHLLPRRPALDGRLVQLGRGRARIGAGGRAARRDGNHRRLHAGGERVGAGGRVSPGLGSGRAAGLRRSRA